MKNDEIVKLDNGLYEVFWKSGGSSLAAIGCNRSGARWIAPSNWTNIGTAYYHWDWVLRVEKIDVDYISHKSAALKEAEVWRKNAENRSSKNICSQISFMNYDKGTGSLPALSDKVESCYLGDSYKDGHYTGVVGGFAADGICIVILDKPIDGVMAVSMPSVCLRKVIKKTQKITINVDENFLDVGPTLTECDCAVSCKCSEPGLMEILIQYYQQAFDNNTSKLLAAAYVKKAFEIDKEALINN